MVQEEGSFLNKNPIKIDFKVKRRTYETKRNWLTRVRLHMSKIKERETTHYFSCVYFLSSYHFFLLCRLLPSIYHTTIIDIVVVAGKIIVVVFDAAEREKQLMREERIFHKQHKPPSSFLLCDCKCNTYIYRNFN